MFVAAIRDKEYGGVAIDSIMMSPTCRLSKGEPNKHIQGRYFLNHTMYTELLIMLTNSTVQYGHNIACILHLLTRSLCPLPTFPLAGNVTLANFPKPPGHPCTSDTSKICDFHEDCADKDDEAKCGEYSAFTMYVLL